MVMYLTTKGVTLLRTVMTTEASTAPILLADAISQAPRATMQRVMAVVTVHITACCCRGRGREERWGVGGSVRGATGAGERGGGWGEGVQRMDFDSYIIYTSSLSAPLFPTPER